ncbi:beta-fructofuranosidase 1-like [Ananas comosus]|uniref:Beta-fructofuranosidase 1-like n=1 Tax=Ananas comosus TaxID=4615 RepID=A0A6P5ERB0_ANACO|nr:beta-fructofuranosidase 1-like [Ananas comosus]
MDGPDDLVRCTYAPLPLPPPQRRRSSARPLTLLPLAISSAALLLLLAALSPWTGTTAHVGPPVRGSWAAAAVSRGPAQGVSEKSTGPILGSSGTQFPWTNRMLLWQRTAYHFQPQKNWMNDPDGPLHYKGWYHLFYQYNPDSAVWGNITWGHAVSRDLIRWEYLDLAMVPDHWYDINGVWTGSATILPDGRIIMLYTGSTNDTVQVQNLAEPADPDDALLRNWVKSDSNPVLLPPPGVGLKDFRDPSTAWFVESDSAWRVTIGSKNREHDGFAMVYKTRDFVNYELSPRPLHVVNRTGMWECVDFYPVSTGSGEGLDTSTEPGPGVKHVLKASLDDDKHDYYAIGTYESEGDTWTPDDEGSDVGIGLRYDYGKYYASKTFYDPVKKRRVLWGWSGETDSEETDLLKGWASVQTIPRTVLYDAKTGMNLLQWPVDEVNSLRCGSTNFSSISISPGSVIPLHVNKASQLDILVEFEIDPSALTSTVEADVEYNCSTSGGAAGQGALGPFGLLVLADKNLTEQTAVYFYVARKVDGGLRTFFCQDELRSSLANDIVKRVYGSSVPMLDGESLSVRILVDHSIVESFAQEGRTCITSRLYPTKAIWDAAKVFLFNNATNARVTAKSITIWEMNSAFIHPYSNQTNS